MAKKRRQKKATRHGDIPSKIVDLREFVERAGISEKNSVGYADTGAWLRCPFEVAPYQFIEFAKKDLQGDEKHALINALSNAKRAIDCQMETVFHSLGVKPTKDNLPSKLQLLKELGIVSPNILGKIGTQRNDVEHRFKKPKRGDVEDSVDIAALFVHAIDAALNPFSSNFYFTTKKLHKTDHVLLHCNFETESHTFEFSKYIDGTRLISRVTK